MNIAETAAKYHHLIPQTYMSAWANNSGTLKIEFINEPGIIVERNKEHIAGMTDYHSIRAGMPICTATDATEIFKVLSGYTVDAMTDGTGKVAELTYAEILEFNVDTGNNIENYPGLKIAKLEEYLDVCKKYELRPVIEIKESVDPAYLSEVVDILSAREEKALFNVISFGREICLKMKALMPSLRVYYLVGYEDVSKENIDFALNNHLDGMDIHLYNSKDFVKAVVASGLDVFVWTIDDIENCEKYYRLGINAITTNSINQEKPEGNWFQQFLWSIRDSLYILKLRVRTFFSEKFSL